ncbi:MAG: hypothetical protein LLG20_18725 [Acidobacteriales bacterium]|nr:hypothetical protein [Terriglobales bacterium]
MNYEREPEDLEEAGGAARNPAIQKALDEKFGEAYRELNAITVILSHAIENSGIQIQPTDLPTRLANFLTVLICERDLARAENGNLEARAIAAEQLAGELEAVVRKVGETVHEAEKLLKRKGE